MVENGPHLLHHRLTQSAYAYLVAAPTPLNSLSSWGIRSKSHLLIRSRSNEINCIVIGKPAHIKGTRGEGVPPRIHPRKLIIHRKWNEHTRGFSTSDQWSNLKEFMSESARVHAWVHAVAHLYACEARRIKRLRETLERLHFVSKVRSWLLHARWTLSWALGSVQATTVGHMTSNLCPPPTTPRRFSRWPRLDRNVHF